MEFSTDALGQIVTDIWTSMLGFPVADEHPVGTGRVLVRHPDAAGVDEAQVAELPVELRMGVADHHRRLVDLADRLARLLVG